MWVVLGRGSRSMQGIVTIGRRLASPDRNTASSRVRPAADNRRCPALRRGAAMSELADDIAAFGQYIRAERGLADNTLLAYGRDLERFRLWAEHGGVADYLHPTLLELSNYVGHLRGEEA